VNLHPKGTRARVLLTSVFGPYAQDDEFGSRSINPMELYHNQVTRAQGSFSLRMFHRSWGIMMIQENISAPRSVLDFPTRRAFARELTTNHYDVVGISSIIVNVLKVAEMCRMVRELSPDSVIVVGGHVAAIPGLDAFTRQVKLVGVYNAALWVMEREFKEVNRSVSEQIHKLRYEIEKEFSVVARLTAASLGPILLWSTRREEKRLASGRTYEPPTLLERRNWGPAS
jgi:hypothetical protein